MVDIYLWRFSGPHVTAAGTSLAESHSSCSSSLYTFSKQIFALLQLAWYHQAELYTGSTLGCHIRDEVLQVICTFEVGYSSQHIDKTYTIQHPEHSLSLTTDRTYMIGPRKVMWDQQAKVLVCISTLQNLTVQFKDWCGGTLPFTCNFHCFALLNVELKQIDVHPMNNCINVSLVMKIVFMQDSR